MAKHSVQRKRKKKGNDFSFCRAVVLVLCFIGVSFGLYLWQSAFSIGQTTPTVDDDDFRPTIGEPPYRIMIDAGHGGSDPGARGVVQESEMTAATAEALSAWLERDPNYIPLTTRESYDSTAKPAERAAAANAQDPDLLLSVHGNSAPEGSNAAGFECYPAVPGRAYHQESYYFAKQLAKAASGWMGTARHLVGPSLCRSKIFRTGGLRASARLLHPRRVLPTDVLLNRI